MRPLCTALPCHLRWLVVGRVNGSYASGSLRTTPGKLQRTVASDKGIISQVDRSSAESRRNLRCLVRFLSVARYHRRYSKYGGEKKNNIAAAQFYNVQLSMAQRRREWN